MAIFQLNRKRGHKFLFNALLFGFSMARILTCALRIGVATHPSNISLSIAANIFLSAGILLVYIIDLILVQRILRARQPEIGWHRGVRIVFRVLYALVALFLVLTIAFVVLQFYTLDENLRRTCRHMQLAAITYFLIIAAIPLVILAVTSVLPKSHKAEEFGQGSMATKIMILAVSSALCTLGAGFKAGASWMTPRPISDPAWYQSKACLYIFYFGLEIVIVYFLFLMRIDRRFHVPNGSSAKKLFVYELEEGREEGIRPQTASSASGRESTKTEERTEA